MSNGLRARNAMRVFVVAGVFTLAACSGLLDVKNPNDVAESALDNPAAAGAMANGVEGAVSRALAAMAVAYGVATDELDWIGSRDAWFDLEKGAVANYLNEFTDQAFPYVGEARYLAASTITRLEAFDADGRLTDRTDLARTYLNAAVIYASIADMYDDFAFSDKTSAVAPIGRANMNSMYDDAIAFLDLAEPIAVDAGDNALRYNIVAYRARVKHARAVWDVITPTGTAVPANALVNDAGANADATAAIALGMADQRYELESNPEAQPTIAIWFEVNGRSEHKLGTVYETLNDPATGALDPTVQNALARFTAFGNESGVFTLTSTRELRLILAESELAQGDSPGFRTELNAVRALDGKVAFTGQNGVSDAAMLQHERSAQLWLMMRRLNDMHRFGLKAPEWLADPNFASAFNCIGLLFPIPNVERLGNQLITGTPSC